MTGNAAYPSPPKTMAELHAAIVKYNKALDDQSTGGSAATAAKNAARNQLIDLLRELALYVQIACKNDLAVLLSSGFREMSTDRASVPLPAISGVRLTNGSAGRLVGRVDPIVNANTYEGRIAPAATPAAFLASVFSSDSQHINFDNCTPGDLYTAQFRALSGSEGMNDWSDPTTHRAM